MTTSFEMSNLVKGIKLETLPCKGVEFNLNFYFLLMSNLKFRKKNL